MLKFRFSQLYDNTPSSFLHIYKSYLVSHNIQVSGREDLLSIYLVDLKPWLCPIHNNQPQSLKVLPKFQWQGYTAYVIIKDVGNKLPGPLLRWISGATTMHDIFPISLVVSLSPHTYLRLESGLVQLERS